MKSVYYVFIICMAVFSIQKTAIAQVHRTPPPAYKTAPPLIVVDGKVMQTASVVDSNYVPSLKPEDIKSIEVLKGAKATVQFGHLGANGVIMITTKKTVDYVKAVLNSAGSTDRPLFMIDGEKFTNREVKLSTEEILRIHIFRGEEATQKYGDQALHGAIEIITKEKPKEEKSAVYQLLDGFDEKDKPLVVIDGKIMTKAFDLEPSEIESITVLKDRAAKKKYGKKGQNGVVEITTKNKLEE